MNRTTRTVTCLAALALAACGADGGDGGEPPRDASAAGRVEVAAAFYPVEEAARAVGGDRARVTSLTPPGTGPHDLELEAPQLAALEESDVVLFLGAGFQPSVDEAVEALAADVRRIDLLDGLELRRIDGGIPGVRGEVDGEKLAGGRDPHVWVDPRNLAAMTDAIAAALTAEDPAGRAVYTRNAQAYKEKVRALDAEFEATLSNCSTRTLVTSHAAFGYLADRYGLEQAPIAGISPEEEPDPQSLAATARRAEADGVKTVFFESLVPRDLSETVAREIGAKTDALDPVEGLTEKQLAAGESYFTVQRDNLAALANGLGCTARG